MAIEISDTIGFRQNNIAKERNVIMKRGTVHQEEMKNYMHLIIYLQSHESRWIEL